MMPGQRVRVARPSCHLCHLKDQTGESITLIPVAKVPLEYRIKLDNGETHALPFDALEVPHVEIEAEEPDDIIIVNNLTYCRRHRLEICGICCLDFLSMNLASEIADNELADQGGSLFKAAEDMRTELESLGFQPRKAPKGGGANQFSFKAEFKPAINDAIILVPKHFDPDSLRQWPTSGWYLENTETFSRQETTCEEDQKLVLRRLRDTIVSAAKQWEMFFKMRSASDPMMRIILQEKAQSQALSLDLVEPVRWFSVGSRKLPLFTVRWAHAFAGSRSAIAVIGTMEQGTKMGEIPCETDAISFMAALLKANGERLDPAFVSRKAKHSPLLSVSVLTAIPYEIEEAYYGMLEEYCSQCGNCGNELKLFRCSRCKSRVYCSRECQKKNWKYHKSSCKSSLPLS